MAVVRLENVSKCFRIYRRPSDRIREWLFRGTPRHERFRAVSGVSIAVEQGTCLALVGSNGSGKSTLLRLIAGVLQPTSGTVHVNGRVSALLELGAGFDPQFTGRENVFLNAAILGFTDAQIRACMRSIEEFAGIGGFIDRPVKTYSSGMFVRLAFAVAVHVEPEVLVIDEVLAVGDIFFQQRCIRRIRQMKEQGVTILFVSHDMEAVKGLADRAVWIDRGEIVLEGPSDAVVSGYLASLATGGRRHAAGEEAIGRSIEPAVSRLEMPAEALSRIPDFLCTLPNVDRRYGNAKARIQGIGVFNAAGSAVGSVCQGDRVCVRISLEFLERVAHPNVGFMLRDRLGADVTGTNLMFEGVERGPAKAGERLSVDFTMDLPFLKSGPYHLAPAVADGTLDSYEICDWVDNACAIEVVERTSTYGHLRIPVGVRVFPQPPLVSPSVPSSTAFALRETSSRAPFPLGGDGAEGG